MATAIQEAWWGAGRMGPQLPSGQASRFQRIIGYKNNDDFFSKQEYKEGEKSYKKSDRAQGDYLSAIAGTIRASALDPELKKLFEKKGYQKFEGYYTTKAPVTVSGISALAAKGFSSGDVQQYIADTFASKYLSSEVNKFLGPNYTVNPTTGKWEKNKPIEVPTGAPTAPSGLDTTISGTTTTKSSGIYAGLNPDAMPGYNPSEIEYAFAIDPYKIQAKSAENVAGIQTKGSADVAKIQARGSERLARLGQGTALYGLIGNVI